MKVLPLFKTTYSIGKSILNLEEPSKHVEGGPDSVLSIAKELDLKQVFLVEDKMHGFLEAKRKFDANDIQMIFGLRFDMCQSYEVEKDSVGSYKAVVFAKNNDGVRKLYKIYSSIFCNFGGKINEADLAQLWCDDLILVIPFYDSFIHKNGFFYKANFMPQFSFCQPIVFLENNNLPFDQLLRREAQNIAKTNGWKTQEVKSIYYKNRKDFKAYQTYRMITNRSFGKSSSIQSPNLDGCASDDFCVESFLEQNG